MSKTYREGKVYENTPFSIYLLNDNAGVYRGNINEIITYEIDICEWDTCKADVYKVVCRKLHTLQEKYNEKKMRINEFCLMDDRFMVKVFEDTECVKLLLRIIMSKPDLEIISIHVEHTLSNLQGRSIRMDINAVDLSGMLYDIEVQRADAGAIPKRARYNSSLLDANIINPGDGFEKLPETYVIFITENDVLGSNLPIYHIERVIQETGGQFGDEAHIIYVNSNIQDNTALGRLMHDFYCKDAESMYYKELADRVDYLKNDEKGVMGMYTYLDKWSIQDREEGRMEGRIEGKAEGSTLKLISQVGRKLVKGKDAYEIAEDLEEDFDMITKICRIAEQFAPDYDTEKIYEAYKITA